ncbi:hypothetical protein ADIS_4835 [Lunatimonas lonarensis]|uniref:Uncharacterized protein n=1 Tax=Lunatimonas lonarensis TaxID=1232681 RepID=R7ZL17_9BACT|nr:hypothetical protein ADIS_4835 [Lunatimonas lonarensis]
MGRYHFCIACIAKGIGPPLVGEYKDQIGWCGLLRFFDILCFWLAGKAYRKKPTSNEVFTHGVEFFLSWLHR